MRKQISILALVVLMFGLVSADYVGTIENIDGINISDFVAGNVATANFSFDYVDGFGDEQYPHILRMNITSENQSDYPVLKGDFELEGFVRKYRLWPFPWYYDVELECSEENPLTINHPLGLNVLNVSDGTFYCYNTTSEALDDLSKHDEVFLTIRSHPALWPGEYGLSASMFYLTDEMAPVVEILNVGDFDLYYRELDSVEVEVNISDGSEVVNKWGEAFLGYENLTLPYTHESNGLFYFSKTLPSNIVEDDYPLFVFVEDEYGNMGNDSVTLKIDRTAPVITLVKPDGSIYTNILPIEVEVVDVKAGLDDASVEYRLREMSGTSICPEDGVGTWDCYNSGWLSLPLISGSLFGVDVDTDVLGLSGEYWLQIRASDVLGNLGVLE